MCPCTVLALPSIATAGMKYLPSFLTGSPFSKPPAPPNRMTTGITSALWKTSGDMLQIVYLPLSQSDSEALCFSGRTPWPCCLWTHRGATVTASISSASSLPAPPALSSREPPLACRSSRLSLCRLKLKPQSSFRNSSPPSKRWSQLLCSDCCNSISCSSCSENCDLASRSRSGSSAESIAITSSDRSFSTSIITSS